MECIRMKLLLMFGGFVCFIDSSTFAIRLGPNCPIGGLSMIALTEPQDHSVQMLSFILINTTSPSEWDDFCVVLYDEFHWTLEMFQHDWNCCGSCAVLVDGLMVHTVAEKKLATQKQKKNTNIFIGNLLLIFNQF